ncbi:hypothetical protein AQZ52_16330 [Novosphingobium fuchskuhlense]|uniref:Uncharacterized protein n=1 Tax=Novosphingobium fuchskuhlense TaxID=1117702 RepID=A0A124JTP5_9SPHN|nr:hypothetical protein [Novosphingobium fuchskuhlense]KUR70397.1 hypothetical protein AQZ52_16330 [Novosphingobium fuchskuhlense]
MDALLSRLTPGHVAQFARIAALLIAFALTMDYVTDRLTLEHAGVGAFFLAVSTLLALPGQRSSELLGALAIWLTYAEFMAAIQSGHFDLWRWAVVLATLSLVIVPIKVQHLRQLARTNPYQPLGELYRRVWTPPAPVAKPAPYVPAALTATCGDPVGEAGLAPGGV